jgi:hypothetical protein
MLRQVKALTLCLLLALSIFASIVDVSNRVYASNDKYNYAPYFTANGSNHVSIPDRQELRLQKFSVSAWFRTTMTNNSSVAIIVNKGGFGNGDGNDRPDMNYGIWITGSNQGVRGKVQAGFENSAGSNYFVTSSNTYNDGNWHYAVVTFDGSVLRLYVDGQQVASLNTNNAIPDYNWDTPLTIGKTALPNVNSNYFIGDIDEVRVYNRALSAQEVSDAYNNGIFSNDGLAFHFDSTYNINYFNIAAVGDFGCTVNTDKVVSAIARIEPERVLGLGDYSYTTSPSCWYEKISYIEDKMRDPPTLAMGNHETPNGSSSNLSEQGRIDLLNRFNITKTYYSFEYGNIHFLVLDTEIPFDSNSNQYKFAKQDLINASTNALIDWIIVYFHKPIYGSKSIHSLLTSFRDVYQPLFDRYGVDIVLQAHNHNYERTKPLKYNTVVTSDEPSIYGDYEGQIYLTIGTGGKSLYSFYDISGYSIRQIVKYGFVNIDVVDNGSKLIVRFYDTNNNIGDEFVIAKARKLN